MKCNETKCTKKQGWKHSEKQSNFKKGLSGILRDKTISKKSTYIHNYDKHN